MVKPDYVWINGHRFIKFQGTVQCAYCLFVQPLGSNVVRRGNRLVTHFQLFIDEEQHAKVCVQNTVSLDKDESK